MVMRTTEMPKEWSKAGSGEEELNWVLYDTEGGTDSANATITFFDQAESSVGADETNMPVGGQLPSKQRFLVKEIHVFINDVVAGTDAANILDRSFLEIKINSRRKFVAPLRMLIGGATVLPAGVTQDEDHVMGDGYILDLGIVVNGGDSISVELDTGETSTSTDTELTVAFVGRLVKPA